ncbi:MAG: PqqD family protein [Candidatus Omnitrophica bacterium]|nr:PqqD family protein [Candidatus Omnitrophota bacterium]
MSEKQLKHAENVVTRDEGDETFLFNADTANFIVINETARFIWDRCEQPVTIDTLLKNILDEYEVGEAEAKKDLDEHIEKLKQSGFLIES